MLVPHLGVIGVNATLLNSNNYPMARRFMKTEVEFWIFHCNIYMRGVVGKFCLNSQRPDEMPQRTAPSVVHVTACHLFSYKLLPELMLTQWWLDKSLLICNLAKYSLHLYTKYPPPPPPPPTHTHTPFYALWKLSAEFVKLEKIDTQIRVC